MLFEGQDERSPEEEKIMSGLMELFEKKFTALLDALFSLDELRWFDSTKQNFVIFHRLNSFMIEDPSSKQLQNIEELQKDLRSLQKKHFSDLCEDDIEVFANKIFRVNLNLKKLIF